MHLWALGSGLLRVDSLPALKFPPQDGNILPSRSASSSLFFIDNGTCSISDPRGSVLMMQRPRNHNIMKRLENLVMLRFFTYTVVIQSSTSSHQNEIRAACDLLDGLFWLGFVLELSWALMSWSPAFLRFLDKMPAMRKKMQWILKESGCKLEVWATGWIALFVAIRNRIRQTREIICKKRSGNSPRTTRGWFYTSESIRPRGRNCNFTNIIESIALRLQFHQGSPMGQPRKEVQLCDTGPTVAPPRSSMERLEANYQDKETDLSMTNKKSG